MVHRCKGDDRIPLVTLRAHFNGEHIILDEPFALTPDMELIITVLSQQASDEDRDAWLRLSSQRLAAAYGENEPEYSTELIKEPNPDYDRR